MQSQKWLLREDQLSILSSFDSEAGTVELPQPVPERVFCLRYQSLEIRDMLFCELVLLKEFVNFIMSTKYGVFSTKWTFPEEQLKNSWVILSLALPFSVRHGQLVEICEQGIRPIVVCLREDCCCIGWCVDHLLWLFGFLFYNF
jgi:hypothetical protein